MGDHIVTSFDEEMRSLSRGLAEMGARVSEQLARAMDGFERRDLPTAQRARAMDAEIDRLHDTIEERVISILALRNPVAIDLRATIAALQIARELERAGDLAKNIAKRCAVVFEDSPGPADAAIAAMGRQSIRLLDDAVSAYNAQDAEGCLSVWRADSAVDDHCNAVFERLLLELAGRTASVGPHVQRLFIAKNLERIGDHATNIAEAVYFILTGRRIEETRPKTDATSTQSARPKTG